MLTESELYEILLKYFSDTFPEKNQDYRPLIHDAFQMGITDKYSLSHIIDIHLVDAIVQDRREIENIILAKFKKADIPNKRNEFLNSPSIIRIVRKCFQLRFGHVWSNYRSNSLGDDEILQFRKQFLKLRFNTLNSPYVHEIVPKYLYKYTTFETALNILKSGKLRFNSPLNFDDIHDIQTDPKIPLCQNELLKVIQDKYEEFVFFKERIPGVKGDINYVLNNMFKSIKRPETSPEILRERNLKTDLKIVEAIRVEHENIINFWKYIVRYFRVLCLTEYFDDPILWQEYGESRNGVLFKFNTDYFCDYYQKVGKVIYVNEFPQIINLNQIANHLMGIQKLNKAKEISKLCFIKEKYKWCHQGEWRIVLLRSDWEGDNLKNFLRSELYDDFEFPNKSLEAIFIDSSVIIRRKNELENILINSNIKISSLN
ncbi:MAG TPA: hypothetical protein PKA63_01400 [Oligoflexia bacterium]|nr:hypothetical protein [Oligoflexia bacterium]HMP47304.1 hypothetical protein [Oligoflexia bacterium]